MSILGMKNFEGMMAHDCFVT